MADAVPAWAHEKAVLRPYNPDWPQQAERARTQLFELLGPWLVDGVEHIGSTAVPGLAAKPIVDLMASVTDPHATVADAAGRLATSGWSYVPPELDGRSWRRFFVKPDPTQCFRVAHLHVIASGHPRWAEQLVFRDALRCDDQLARRYETLKRTLAERHGHDREAYTEAKAEFIGEVLDARARD